MATLRAPSFYSNFLRAVRSCEPKTYQSIRVRPPPKARHTRRTLHVSSQTGQEVQQRYGPAVSPSLPPPPKPTESRESQKLQPPRKEQSEAVDEKQNAKASPSIEKEEPSKPKATSEAAGKDAATPENANESLAKEAKTEEELLKEQKGVTDNRELNEVLSIPAPSEMKSTHRHPHLETPPYEHNFDTYSLVQQLSTSGLTWNQSITIMKAVRLMLANNLDMAKDSLVSKSDIENESYLFRAACSELRTTVQTNRLAETQRLRSQRAHLQHDYEILNQKMSQDLTTMREDLKSQFNDRKMGLEEEKRKIDGKIAELNYEITVLMNSEAKSEVEGLRWILTRRAAMAIAIAALMIISSLNYSSIKAREKEEQEKKKKAALKAHEEREARQKTAGRSQGTQTDESHMSNFEESLG